MDRARGHTAVMASKQAVPPEDLQFFPTPPWAVRAFLARLVELYPDLGRCVALEPACGQLHLALPMAEVFGRVLASDVFDYGVQALARELGVRLLPPADFAQGPLPAEISAGVDWVLTNPPFAPSLVFARRALEIARKGVALFVRLQWLEGETRHRLLFAVHPPRLVVLYVERVGLYKGRWVPDGGTASAYAWVVWEQGWRGPTQFEWLPAGQKARHFRDSDLRLPAEAA